MGYKITPIVKKNLEPVRKKLKKNYWLKQHVFHCSFRHLLMYKYLVCFQTFDLKRIRVDEICLTLCLLSAAFIFSIYLWGKTKFMANSGRAARVDAMKSSVRVQISHSGGTVSPTYHLSHFDIQPVKNLKIQCCIEIPIFL